MELVSFVGTARGRRQNEEPLGKKPRTEDRAAGEFCSFQELISTVSFFPNNFLQTSQIQCKTGLGNPVKEGFGLSTKGEPVKECL